jgi:membrane-associated protease RseP (regulator of RpoE activity)
MSFIWYDLALLVTFLVFVSFFVYSRKKKIQKEGLLLLYKTPWGIKFINKIGKKYKRTIKVLSWASIISGYLLMAGMTYLVYNIIKIYLFNRDIVRAIKVPPIMPLIPYIDKIVPGLPSFYFFYWIVIIIIIAIPHEFAHGVLAAYNKVKIKTTGFGFFPSFLPIFLAAFVELDEKKMEKKEKFPQMAILSAGTFANVLVAILFLGLLWIIFPLFFSPSGVIFDSYQLALLNTSDVQSINGIQNLFLDYNSLLGIIGETELANVSYLGSTYLLTKELVIRQGYSEAMEKGYLIVYENSPAINQKLEGAIIGIDNKSIESLEQMQEEVSKHKPGDTIRITTTVNKSIINIYEIVLGENPDDKTKPWLGIGIMDSQQRPLAQFFSKFAGFKDSHIEYTPKFGELSNFIYNLFWWVTIISFSVALVNMLPMGLFDGGRFFYLTIFALTKSEQKAKKTFSFLTYFFLAIIVLLMILWASSFF